MGKGARRGKEIEEEKISEAILKCIRERPKKDVLELLRRFDFLISEEKEKRQDCLEGDQFSHEKRSIELVSGNNHKCDICGQPFTTIKRLWIHKWEKHK